MKVKKKIKIQPSFCFPESSNIAEFQHLSWIKISKSRNFLKNYNLLPEDIV